MADDLKNTICQNVEGPRRARADSAEMEQHQFTEQGAADRYLNFKKAIKNGVGIRLTKFTPPGA